MASVVSSISSVVRIQRLFDAWRALGHKQLRNGTEVIARIPAEGGEAWMHAVFAGLSPEQIGELDYQLDGTLPADLRALWRWCNGMTLFSGAFRVFGRTRPGLYASAAALQPADLVAHNHELAVFGWKPPGAVAFAQNGWDLSVHVTGMGRQPREVVRCERATGRVLERHAHVFDCLASRICKLDDLVVG